MTGKLQIGFPARLVKASTITDGEVRALRATLARRSDRRGLYLVRMCNAALGTRTCTNIERDACAEAFNACHVRPGSRP